MNLSSQTPGGGHIRRRIMPRPTHSLTPVKNRCTVVEATSSTAVVPDYRKDGQVVGNGSPMFSQDGNLKMSSSSMRVMTMSGQNQLIQQEQRVQVVQYDSLPTKTPRKELYASTPKRVSTMLQILRQRSLPQVLESSPFSPRPVESGSSGISPDRFSPLTRKPVAKSNMRERSSGLTLPTQNPITSEAPHKPSAGEIETGNKRNTAILALPPPSSSGTALRLRSPLTEDIEMGVPKSAAPVDTPALKPAVAIPTSGTTSVNRTGQAQIAHAQSNLLERRTTTRTYGQRSIPSVANMAVNQPARHSIVLSDANNGERNGLTFTQESPPENRRLIRSKEIEVPWGGPNANILGQVTSSEKEIAKNSILTDYVILPDTPNRLSNDSGSNHQANQEHTSTALAMIAKPGRVLRRLPFSTLASGKTENRSDYQPLDKRLRQIIRNVRQQRAKEMKSAHPMLPLKGVEEMMEEQRQEEKSHENPLLNCQTVEGGYSDNLVARLEDNYTRNRYMLFNKLFFKLITPDAFLLMIFERMKIPLHMEQFRLRVNEKDFHFRTEIYAGPFCGVGHSMLDGTSKMLAAAHVLERMRAHFPDLIRSTEYALFPGIRYTKIIPKLMDLCKTYKLGEISFPMHNNWTKIPKEQWWQRERITRWKCSCTVTSLDSKEAVVHSDDGFYGKCSAAMKMYTYLVRPPNVPLVPLKDFFAVGAECPPLKKMHPSLMLNVPNSEKLNWLMQHGFSADNADQPLRETSEEKTFNYEVEIVDGKMKRILNHNELAEFRDRLQNALESCHDEKYQNDFHRTENDSRLVAESVTTTVSATPEENQSVAMEVDGCQYVDLDAPGEGEEEDLFLDAMENN